MKISIIVPTYNERTNLPVLVERIAKVLMHRNHEIIVVDDNSPDGTGDVAEELKKNYKMKVLHRKSKRGLASAVIDGFKISDGDIIGVMDADLSHPPEAIEKLIQPILNGTADFVVGSRFVPGGGIKGWSVSRKIISGVASAIAKPLTSVKDPMSGFFFVKRSVFTGIKLNPRGYKIGLELLVRGNYRNVVEVPYVFTDRYVGKSKLNVKEYVNYLMHAFNLYSSKLKSEIQFLKFCTVGATGLLVHIAVFWLCTEFFKIWYIASGGIAFFIAVCNNFAWNKIWTFEDFRKGFIIALQFGSFFTVCVIGACVYLLALYTFVDICYLPKLIAVLLAIGCSTSINFLGSKYWSFKLGMRVLRK
jgi:dolichol-phosphate mannosyltransferase